MKNKAKTLLAKIEASNDVDAVPTGAEAILTQGIEVGHYEGGRVVRDIDNGLLGAKEEINASPNITLRFALEIAGAGGAGNVPAYDDLLRACGLSSTIDAGTDVQYDPVSDNYDSMTGYFLRPGKLLQTTTGVRGNMALTLAKGQLPLFTFNFLGTYNKPVAPGAYTLDTSGFIAPLPVTKRNTPVLTVDGFAAPVDSFTFDMGNQLVWRDVPNQRGAVITNREGAGEIVMEAPDIAAKDFFSLLESHAGTVNKVVITVVHGTTAGNIIELDFPSVQILDVMEVDLDGELGYRIPFKAIPSSTGDDEFKFTAK